MSTRRISTHTGHVSFDDGKTLIFNLPKRAADLMPTEAALLLLDNSPATVPELVEYALRAGYLTSLTEAEELAWFRQEVDSIETLNGTLAIVSVVPTNSCNLACSYCFQADTGMRDLGSRHLTMDEASNVMKTIDGLRSGRGISHLELFGGEPLLPRTRQVVTYLVREAGERGLTTRATTNGTHLHQFEDLLSPDLLCDLQISLDGSRQHHDKRRVPLTGAPTFNRIFDNIKLALSRGVKVFIRPNIDRRNLEGLTDLISFLKSEGILDNPLVSFNYVNVIPDPLTPDASTEFSMSREAIAAFIRDSEVDATGLTPDSDLANFLSDAMKKPHIYACGAPNRNIYFSPGGQVYNCHELVGRPEMAVGHMESGSFKPLPIWDAWKGRRIDKLQNCQRCPLSYLHGGGCGARLSPDKLSWLGNCDGYQDSFAEQVRELYRARPVGG
ncbi:radical SAM protein [Arthrobacter humicola]